MDALLGNWNNGDAYNNREDKGADWISDSPFWLKIDDDGCDNNTNRHDHVAQSVAISSTDIDISLIWCLRVAVSMVAFTVSMAFSLFMIVVVTTQMVMSLTLMKNWHLNEIEEKTGNSGDKHNLGIEFWRIKDSVYGLLQKVEGDSNKENNTNEGSDDLGSVPSIGKFFASVFLREFKAEDGNSKTNHICSKMCSIRNNSNGAWKVTTDGLRNDEKYGNKWD